MVRSPASRCTPQRHPLRRSRQGSGKCQCQLRVVGWLAGDGAMDGAGADFAQTMGIEACDVVSRREFHHAAQGIADELPEQAALCPVDDPTSQRFDRRRTPKSGNFIVHRSSHPSACVQPPSRYSLNRTPTGPGCRYGPTLAPRPTVQGKGIGAARRSRCEDDVITAAHAADEGAVYFGHGCGCSGSLPVTVADRAIQCCPN